MRRKFLAIMLAMTILLLTVFLLPLVSYSSSFYQVGGGTYDHWAGLVSASYLVSKCGVAFDLNLTTMVVGNGSWVYTKVMQGPTFVCFSQPNQILGGVRPYSVTTERTGVDSISLPSGATLCASNCNYLSPYLSATVLVNASSSPLTNLHLYVNGTDEGIVATFSNSTMTNFAYQLRANPHASSMPIQAGKTYSIFLVATFRDGETSTATGITTAS